MAGYAQKEIDEFYNALKEAGLGQAGIGGGFGLSQSTKFTIGSAGGLMGVVGALIGSEVTAAQQEKGKENWTPKIPIAQSAPGVPIENYLSQEIPMNVPSNPVNLNRILEKINNIERNEALKMQQAMQQAQTTNAYNRGFGEYVAPTTTPKAQSIPIENYLSQEVPMNVPSNPVNLNKILEKIGYAEKISQAMQQAQTTNAYNRGFGEYIAPNQPNQDFKDLREKPLSPPIDTPRTMPHILNPNIGDVIGGIRERGEWWDVVGNPWEIMQQLKGQESGAILPGDNAGAIPIPGEDTGAIPIPGEDTGAIPIPGDNTGAIPIPGEDTGAIPIPGENTGAIPIPGDKTGTITGEKEGEADITAEKEETIAIPKEEVTTKPKEDITERIDDKSWETTNLYPPIIMPGTGEENKMENTTIAQPEKSENEYNINYAGLEEWLLQQQERLWEREDAIRKETQAREDNAYQRAVADARKAGFNINLMDIEPAASGGGITAGTALYSGMLENAMSGHSNRYMNSQNISSQEYIAELNNATKLLEAEINNNFKGSEGQKERIIELIGTIIQGAATIIAFRRGGQANR